MKKWVSVITHSLANAHTTQKHVSLLQNIIVGYDYRDIAY